MEDNSELTTFTKKQKTLILASLSFSPIKYLKDILPTKSDFKFCLLVCLFLNKM